MTIPVNAGSVGVLVAALAVAVCVGWTAHKPQPEIHETVKYVEKEAQHQTVAEGPKVKVRTVYRDGPGCKIAEVDTERDAPVLTTTDEKRDVSEARQLDVIPHDKPQWSVGLGVQIGDQRPAVELARRLPLDFWLKAEVIADPTHPFRSNVIVGLRHDF